MQDLRHKRELLIMKLDLDYGYGINNVFWKSILDDCSEEEEKVIRARLKKETPRQYKEFQEFEKEYEKLGQFNEFPTEKIE